MKKLASLLGTFIMFYAAMAQPSKSDRKDNGYKGKVRSVIAQRAKLSNKGGQWIESQPQISYAEGYDEQGNLTESVSFDDCGNISQQTVYSFLDGDRVAKFESFQPDYGISVDFTSSAIAKPHDARYDQRYKYRYKGHTVEEMSYDNKGMPGSRSVKTFDPKGQEVKFESYAYNGRLSFRSESRYDEKGNEAEVTYYNAAGDVTNVYRYTDYQVDSEGNWTQRQSWQSKAGKTGFVPYEIERRACSYYGKSAPVESANARLKVISLPETLLRDRAINQVVPAWPPEYDAGVAEDTLIEITVGEQGDVISATGVSGDKALVEAAIEAVKQWRFIPVKLIGQPVKIIGRLRFSFYRVPPS